MSALRPLPPRPSLEFEHKEAKALLRRLRAGDAESLTRARERHPALDPAAPERILLADVQLVIAREYGFASWPRLVRYFGDLDRQQRTPRLIQPYPYDASVRGLLAGHRGRSTGAGRALAAYVPRFFGLPVDDVFAAEVTEDDARLAVARSNGAPSWQELLERSAAAARMRTGPMEADPLRDIRKAMETADLGALKRLTSAAPDLLRSPEYDGQRPNLLAMALHHERTGGREVMRPIIEWLQAEGLDLQLVLDTLLCGWFPFTNQETVRHLLDRGADPDWVAPNGATALEHALLRCWNGAIVDLIAARAHPRKALWIAAGLGDVDGVRAFLDAAGRPTAEARRDRPDLAIGRGPMPQLPDPDDEEVLMEVFFVAMINGRTAVLEYLVSRGFPVNSLLWGEPMVCFAVGNAMTPVVECLVRCGADLDLRSSQGPAREIARQFFEERPEAPGRRRIVELCGMDPDVVLKERDARPVPPPTVSPQLEQALELAGDDAARLGQSDIRPENLLFGVLRVDEMVRFFAQLSRMDLDRFRVEVGERVRPAEDRVEQESLLLDADAQATVQAAIAAAAERRQEVVMAVHLLYTLVRTGSGPAADLLARYGSSAAIVTAALERSL